MAAEKQLGSEPAPPAQSGAAEQSTERGSATDEPAGVAKLPGVPGHLQAAVQQLIGAEQPAKKPRKR